MTLQRMGALTPVQEAMAAGITWEEPPERRSGPGAASLPWAAWGRILRRHPGRWAKLHTWGSKGGAYAARKGAGAKALRPDEFELRAVHEGKTSSVLYGRYLGDEDEA